MSVEIVYAALSQVYNTAPKTTITVNQKLRLFEATPNTLALDRFRPSDSVAERTILPKKLSFAAAIKGTATNAVSITIPAGEMEQQPRMSGDERQQVRELMRAKYAVHHSETIPEAEDDPDASEPTDDDELPEPEDDGRPMRWR